jgi:hypothetical protein
MTEKFNFNQVIDPALDEGIERRFELQWPAPENQEDIEGYQAKALHFARSWCGRVFMNTGTKDFTKILIAETRPDNSLFFHVFLAGCDWKRFEEEKHLHGWYLLTGSRAEERFFEPEHLRELLRRFVMERGCSIDIFTPTFNPNAAFRREDFE